AKFIEETLVSVFNQTYQPIEYIVIDGGSTDGSQEIIKKYSDHINYWVSEKDNGQSDAINKGLLRSTGEIVCWLNSDDILLQDAIEKAIKFFEAEPSVDFIHGKSILFGDGKREKIIGDKINDLSLRYVSYIPFPQPSSFFRRKIIEETGLLKTDLHYGMDFELLARVALKYKILHV
ncbi:MAG: glycosyltransferase family 2 protein, partial [Bacteroidota bacterium]